MPRIFRKSRDAHRAGLETIIDKGHRMQARWHVNPTSASHKLRALRLKEEDGERLRDAWGSYKSNFIVVDVPVTCRGGRVASPGRSLARTFASPSYSQPPSSFSIYPSSIVTARRAPHGHSLPPHRSFPRTCCAAAIVVPAVYTTCPCVRSQPASRLDVHKNCSISYRREERRAACRHCQVV